MNDHAPQEAKIAESSAERSPGRDSSDPHAASPADAARAAELSADETETVAGLSANGIETAALASAAPSPTNAESDPVMLAGAGAEANLSPSADAATTPSRSADQSAAANLSAIADEGATTAALAHTALPDDDAQPAPSAPLDEYFGAGASTLVSEAAETNVSGLPYPEREYADAEADPSLLPYADAESAPYPRPRGVVQINRALFFLSSAFAAALIIALTTATVWLATRSHPEANPVVATVNGEPIRRNEYDAAVAKNNGSDVLDGLVLERLVADEAKKRNIVIADDEVAKLVGEQKQNFGTEQAWQAALAQAGLTEEELTKQLRLSAMLRKMVADKVQISDAELQATLDSAKEQFAGMDPEAAKQQARASLQRQKENSAVQDLVAQLKSSATIEKKLPG